MPNTDRLRYPNPIRSISEIRQFDLSGVSREDQEKELADFGARLREWEKQLDGIGAGKPGTVSVESPVFRGSWLIPCIESILYQSSTDWTLSMLWDEGDQLAYRILELLRRFDHPKIRVHFGKNRGIAGAHRFLSEHSAGDYIMTIDDDDMLEPTAVEKLLEHAQAKPWSSIVRARRKFIDEVGNLVDQDPWFPFEQRHFQHGMVTDIHNHCQPAMISRAAYNRTSGWEGFADFHNAGADCDIYLKAEELGSVELIDDILYYYRLHGGRTSHRLTPAGAFEMWRRLADKTIQRRGLPLIRVSETPPFQYQRIERERPTRDSVDFVIVRGGASRHEGQTERTVESLKRCGIANEAVQVVISENGLPSARNQGFRHTKRPIVFYIDSGAEFTSENAVDELLAVMHEHDADVIGPRIRPEDTDDVAEAPWLPAAILGVRREVMLGTGGFDEQHLLGAAADVDFCLRARSKDFKCVYAGGVEAVYDALEINASGTLNRLREKWLEFPQLLSFNGTRSLDEIAPPHELAEPVVVPAAAAEHLDLGNSFAKLEQWQEAEDAYRRAIEEAPDFAQAHENLAHVLSKLRKWEEAVDAFRQAIQLNGRVASLHYSLGDVLFELERWQEVVDAQRQAARLEPARAWTHNNLANALMRLHRWEEAAKSYKRALSLEPGIASAHHSLGDALLHQNRWEAAAKAYQRAIELRPDFFWSHFNRANAFFFQKRWEEAAEAYERAIELDPEFSWSHSNLGAALAELGKGEEAVEAYRRAIALKPDVFSTYEKLGHALSALERWEESAGAFRQAIALDPNVASAHYNLADALSQLEQWEEAVSVYRRAVQLQSDRAWTYNKLGNALYKLQRWRAACGAYMRALSIDPELAEAQQSLADALFQQSRWPEAADAYKRAVELRPDFFWSQFNRASSFFHLRVWEKAVPEYERAIEMRPDYAPSHNYLGDAFCRLGRWEDAAASYRRAVKLRPDQLYLENLAEVASTLARWDEGAAAYGRALAAGKAKASIHYGLANALSKLERWEAAAVAYQHAIELAPDVQVYYEHLGRVLSRVERWEETLAAYERARSLGPAPAFVYHGLGDAYLRFSRWDDAITAYRHAIELEPGYSWSHNNLANVFCQIGRWDEAAAGYRRAAELHPEPSTYQNLGNALFNLERWEEAVAAYRSANELDPNLFWSQNNLAVALSRLERWEESVAPFRRAAELNPEASSRLYREMGDSLLKLERWKEASAAYVRAEELNPEWSRAGAGQGVVRAERWIRNLASVEAGGKTRYLFILDTDYGELTTVMYLLLGQDLRNQSVLLLPPRLYVTNNDVLRGRTRPYSSLNDIVKAVDKEKPEIVFFCSAYLFSIHHILPIKELEKLIRLIRGKGCQVVTADPFLGTLANANPSTVSIAIPENAPEALQRVKQTQDGRLIEHFSESFRILKDLVHLYPAYTGSPTPRKGTLIDEVQTASFFNPKLIYTGQKASKTKAPDKPHWFFMIASRDYETQVIFRGKDWFIDVLVGKLEQAQRAGRHAVFIGPYDCVQSTINRLTRTDNVTLLSFCSFQRFSSLLLSAEYAFYWNSLSHSMLLRLFNGAPVFQFDKGHLVRNVKPLYKRIVDCYYQGWEPIYLDQEDNLDLEKLERLAGEYRDAAKRVRTLLQRAPEPAEMIGQIKKKAARQRPVARKRFAGAIAAATKAAPKRGNRKSRNRTNPASQTRNPK